MPSGAYQRSSSETLFWKYVLKKRPQDCWLWTGGKAGEYGYISRKRIGAHRFSYSLHYGEIPNGQFVLHKCDIKLCVNPNHLFLGTQQDNIDDAVFKDRHVYGEKQGASRLTDELVLDIRKRYSFGNVTQRELAKEFGVCQWTISACIRRSTWKHLP